MTTWTSDAISLVASQVPRHTINNAHRAAASGVQATSLPMGRTTGFPRVEALALFQEFRLAAVQCAGWRFVRRSHASAAAESVC